MMSRSHLRVLLVEDDENLIDLVLLALNGEDFMLEVARDGREGVEKAKAFCPDLVLMDVVMPRMNGYEAARAIRHEKPTKNIPIFFLTAKSLEEDIQEGKNAGGDLYLVKPFSPFELIGIINKFFERHTPVSP